MRAGDSVRRAALPGALPKLIVLAASAILFPEILASLATVTLPPLSVSALPPAILAPAPMSMPATEGSDGGVNVKLELLKPPPVTVMVAGRTGRVRWTDEIGPFDTSSSAAKPPPL